MLKRKRQKNIKQQQLGETVCLYSYVIELTDSYMLITISILVGFILTITQNMYCIAVTSDPITCTISTILSHTLTSLVLLPFTPVFHIDKLGSMDQLIVKVNSNHGKGDVQLQGV